MPRSCPSEGGQKLLSDPAANESLGLILLHNKGKSLHVEGAARLAPSITDALLSQLHDLGHIVLGIYLPICIDGVGFSVRRTLRIFRGQPIAQLQAHHSV